MNNNLKTNFLITSQQVVPVSLNLPPLLLPLSHCFSYDFNINNNFSHFMQFTFMFTTLKRWQICFDTYM